LKRLSLSQIVGLSILVGGVGGILSGEWPKIGAVMTVVGVLASLWEHYSSEARTQEVDDIFEAGALLLAKTGAGNVYSESARIQLNRGRTAKAFEHLKKAHNLNPRDPEALASLTAFLAIQLAAEQWIGRGDRPSFRNVISDVKALAKSGLEIAPENHVFHDSLGIILDVEGNHEDARKEFQKSGTLRSDPFWHLLMATSWGMSGQHDQGLAEVRRALEKGANSWTVDFYHGRALNLVGEYDEALVPLNKAIQVRKNHVQILSALADAYYFQGRFGKAAQCAGRLCFVLLTCKRFSAALPCAKRAAHHLLLHCVLGFSKRVWPISSCVPFLMRLHLKVCSPAQPEDTLALTLIKRGHYRIAEAHLRAACKTLPHSAHLLANLASCLALQGKKSDALQTCEQALQVTSDKRLIAELQQYRMHLERNDLSKPQRFVMRERVGC
jgi:tetratricopeptide (TPR) repeat protein